MKIIYMMKSGCGECTMTQYYAEEFAAKNDTQVEMVYINPTEHKKQMPCSNCKSLKDRCNTCQVYNAGVDNYLEMCKMTKNTKYPTMYDPIKLKLHQGLGNIRVALQSESEANISAGKHTLPNT